ncbi:MAG TPA: J domain-containing protein [Paludibacter sp.]|nr:J domain-containing protein [Paludibacter sp.]
MDNAHLELTEDYKKLKLQYEYLKKEFSELYMQKTEMLTYTESYLNAMYIKFIGQRQYRKFCMNVELLQIKQRIQLIQGYLNRNEKPDLSAIDREIEKRFEAYREKLHAESQKILAANAYLKSDFLPDDIVGKIKDVYRLIVKRLHPDLNKNLTEWGKDLFVKAQAAYDLCDLQTLNEILLSLGTDVSAKIPSEALSLKTCVEKLEENVGKLKRQIEKLNIQFPFIYAEKLNDTAWVEKEQKVIDTEIGVLEKEIEKLSEYMLLLQTWKPELLN